MLINTGRNRGILFISRSVVSFPSPTGIMLVGTKLVGVKVNIPYLELDFGYQGLSSVDVDAILVYIDNNYDAELTWRVIDLRGNSPIVDQITYDSLIAKGFEIYGDTDFIVTTLRFKSISDVSTTFEIVYSGTGTPTWDDGIGNVLTGTTVVFPWTTTTEKTVNVSVEEYDKLTSLSQTEFQDKGLTYMNMAVMTGANDHIQLQNNSNLTIFIPPITNVLGNTKAIRLDNCNILGTLDFSNISSTNRTSFYVGGNTNLEYIIWPSDMSSLTVVNTTGCTSLKVLDASGFAFSVGTLRLTMNNCPSLTTFIGPTSPAGFISDFDLDDTTSLVGEIDCSNFGRIQHWRIGSAMSVGNMNTGVTVIKSPGILYCDVAIQYFSNAVFDWTANTQFYPRSAYFRYFDQDTPMNYIPLIGQSNLAGGATTFSYMPTFTGILDWSYHRSSSTMSIVNVPNITGIIAPITLNDYSYIAPVINGANDIYVDWTTHLGMFYRSNAHFQFLNSGLSSANLNHMLVDLAATFTVGTGRTISMHTGNGVVDSTSGGYDGLTAAATLVSNGFNVNINT